MLGAYRAIRQVAIPDLTGYGVGVGCGIGMRSGLSAFYAGAVTEIPDYTVGVSRYDNILNNNRERGYGGGGKIQLRSIIIIQIYIQQVQGNNGTAAVYLLEIDAHLF